MFAATFFKVLMYLGPFLKELLFGSPEIPNAIRRHKFAAVLVLTNALMLITFFLLLDVTIKLSEQLVSQRKSTDRLEVKVQHLESLPPVLVVPDDIKARIIQLEADVKQSAEIIAELREENRLLREQLPDKPAQQRRGTRSRLHELKGLM